MSVLRPPWTRLTWKGSTFSLGFNLELSFERSILSGNGTANRNDGKNENRKPIHINLFL